MCSYGHLGRSRLGASDVKVEVASFLCSCGHLGGSSLGAGDVKVEVASFCAVMNTLVDQDGSDPIFFLDQLKQLFEVANFFYLNQPSSEGPPRLLVIKQNFSCH